MVYPRQLPSVRHDIGPTKAWLHLRIASLNLRRRFSLGVWIAMGPGDSPETGRYPAGPSAAMLVGARQTKPRHDPEKPRISPCNRLIGAAYLHRQRRPCPGCLRGGPRRRNSTSRSSRAEAGRVLVRPPRCHCQAGPLYDKRATHESNRWRDTCRELNAKARISRQYRRKHTAKSNDSSERRPRDGIQTPLRSRISSQ